MVGAQAAAPGSADEALLEAVKALPDPEIPVISLGDLGMVRGIHRDKAQCVVSITPTYSGCPATDSIRDDILRLLKALGEENARVEMRFAPAWSTDWISEAGRSKLKAYGIAPPMPCINTEGLVPTKVLQFKPAKPAVRLQCPRCASEAIERISEFGSTPCKALYRCLDCREPFDYFKPY
ncbi:MAG: phenylacetate-CoA oxygenase subunit PaaJ [Proteobacteria bacterium]|nr:phenylacetate-CoA oxygenase subunit PaaJ [Pseudomonadota bacterium]